jgi:predicted transposase YbfD/YdcC
MAGSLIAGSDIRGYLRRVTAAREISAKSNEIPAFAPLLADIDDEHLRGAVVTMDALHAQRDHAAYLVEQRHAHYLVTVKGNQPNLSKQLRALPWDQVPVVHRSHDVGHGREEHRELQAVTVHDLLFPHARQVLRITRRRRALGARRWTTETVYAITDLAWEQATARELAEWARGHWTIENSVHWVARRHLRRRRTPTAHRSRPGRPRRAARHRARRPPQDRLGQSWCHARYFRAVDKPAARLGLSGGVA